MELRRSNRLQTTQPAALLAPERFAHLRKSAAVVLSRTEHLERGAGGGPPGARCNLLAPPCIHMQRAAHRAGPHG